MRKKIIVPTDFSVESLSVLRLALQDLKHDEQADVLLVHGMRAEDSITELLFFSKRKLIESLTNDAFNEACKILGNKFSERINSFRIDIFRGFTQRAFDTYVDAERVDIIYMAASTSEMRQVTNGSFDVRPFIRHSQVPVREVSLNEIPVLEKGMLAELFLNGIQIAQH